MRVLHVGAGLLALVFGTLALSAPKGAWLHRKSGIVFVCAMLVMSSSGALMAALQPEVVVVNVIAGVLTFYLVLTALLTVRRPVPDSHRIDTAAMLVALTAGLGSLIIGFAALGNGASDTDDAAPVYVMFGAVALLATLGDVRMLRAGRLQGPRRIARHLWRMCFGLFIAAGSFFLGPPQRLPAPLRGSALRPIPVLLVLAAMVFWLARVRLAQRWRRA